MQANKITALHRGRRNKLFSPLFIDADKTLQRRSRPTPCKEAPGGGVCSSIKTMALEAGAGGGNGSIMMVVFVCLCLANKKPFEREFFVPA